MLRGSSLVRSSTIADASTAKGDVTGAAKAGASLIYLPEAADFVARSADIYKLTHSKENADYLKGIQAQAKEHKVFIGVGVHEPNVRVQRI